MNTIWEDSVEGVKSVIVTTQIATCICGLWFRDGTYREIVRHIRREGKDIPVVIVSASECATEYCDFLSAMSIGALDCICYPFQLSHFDAILESAIASHTRATHWQGAPDYEDCVRNGAA